MTESESGTKVAEKAPQPRATATVVRLVGMPYEVSFVCGAYTVDTIGVEVDDADLQTLYDEATIAQVRLEEVSP